MIVSSGSPSKFHDDRDNLGVGLSEGLAVRVPAHVQPALVATALEQATSDRARSQA